MVRFVENLHVGSTILGGYQGNLSKQWNVQIPVVVRFVRGFSVKVEAAKAHLEVERHRVSSQYPPFCRRFLTSFDWLASDWSSFMAHSEVIINILK